MGTYLRSIFNRQFIATITSMLLVAMVIIWWQTKPNSRTEKATEQVFTIAKEIRKSYIKKIDYWGLNNNTVLSNSILTKNFYKDNNLVNALDKPIYIGQGAEGNMVMPGGRSFDIVYDNLSKSECVALAGYNYTQQDILGLLKITIIGKTTQEFSWTEKDYKLPIKRTKANDICKKNSIIVWTLE